MSRIARPARTYRERHQNVYQAFPLPVLTYNSPWELDVFIANADIVLLVDMWMRKVFMLRLRPTGYAQHEREEGPLALSVAERNRRRTREFLSALADFSLPISKRIPIVLIPSCSPHIWTLITMLPFCQTGGGLPLLHATSLRIKPPPGLPYQAYL